MGGRKGVIVQAEGNVPVEICMALEW
jgi:hypothetical protein